MGEGLIPIPKNENKRLSALEYYDILDTEAEAQFDRLTLLASEICGVPISLVSLLDGTRQWFKSSVGLDAKETPREISFCQHAIMQDGIFEIENALKDDRFANNVLVTGNPDIRFYAGHPLKDSNGFNLGTLCVIDTEPKKLNKHQSQALKILAEEVVEAIESRKKVHQMREYQKFFNLSLDFLCIATTEGYFKSLNPTFVEKLGYTEEALLSKPLIDFVHKDDASATLVELHQLAKGHKTRGFVNRFKKKDGKYVWLHWTCQPDPFSGELFAAAHDISALKEKETLLKESIDHLDQFAYIVSHDLKSPLNAISTISGFIEEDLSDKLDGSTEEHFDILKSSVKRMNALLEGILEYSRLGRIEENLLEIDPYLMLDETIKELNPADSFTIKIDDNLPIIKYSEIQLKQVFHNLISNAIKFHDKEKGLIEVIYSEDEKYHRIKIKDDGPGIDSKQHDRIFTMFHRLRPNADLEGTGIGLSVVKKIVEDNGGTIKVHSELGSGASFEFTILK